MTDTLILPLANALLDCLETELELNPSPPAQYCLRAGTLVIHDVNAQNSTDTACCPGLGYVRIGSVMPSGNLPEADPRSESCLTVQRSVELTMGVVRCVPGMGEPEGPSCNDWTGVVTREANDIDAMWKALCCWSRTDEFKAVRKRPLSIIASNVIQEADCIERFMTVLAAIPKCC